MKCLPCVLLLFACGSIGLLQAADPPVTEPPKKPALKITPGEVIIPTDRMQRIWGELISIDPATRTGKFRKEATDEVMNFTVMPYAELLHHAHRGDLQDYRVGERAIFRMHENEAGEWIWLTYIQDEMNFLNGHKEYFYVDEIDAEKGALICTQANFDKSFVREKGIRIDTDGETRYWKAGQPAKFADIQVGDKLRTKTHGAGKGKTRVCWEVFLDDESLLKFQAEQKLVHAARMKAEGAPGYVDEVNAESLRLTLFPESATQSKQLPVGAKVTVAPAGIDRKPASPAVNATVVKAEMAGQTCKVTLKLASGSEKPFVPKGLARFWKSEE